MINKKQLLLTLDMLTQGVDAPVTESLKPEAHAVNKAEKKWTMAKGIQGLGIGHKITLGESQGGQVLKVYVEKKLPLNKCKAPIPKVVKIASLDQEIPTDVEAIGIVSAEANTLRTRPLVPGFSVGHPKVSAGTLGCFVRLNGDDAGIYILSNSHVLADEGMARMGDDIIQPGKFDGGKTATDVVAALANFVPFQFTKSTFPNRVDAAIAKVSADDRTTLAIHKIGVPTGLGRVRIGTQVQKTGRTTDYTVGRVTDVNYRFSLTYMKPGEARSNKFRVGFTDQILCTRYTAGGDSGSAVLNMDEKVVGLHFAGSPSTSIFSPIRFVIDALEIEIII